MSNNFECIYKILRALEKAMDFSEFDISQIDRARHKKAGQCPLKNKYISGFRGKFPAG